MAISFVGSQENYQSSPSSPLGETIDIGTRTNGLLVVGIVASVSGTIDTISLAYDSAQLTQVDELTFYNDQWYVSLFYLAAPSDGSNSLQTSWAMVDEVGLIQSLYTLTSWYDGVDQSTPYDTTNKDTGITDPSVSITPTNANSLIVSQYGSRANDVLSVGSGETLIDDYDSGGNVFGGSYAIQDGGPSAQTIDFSGADETWGMIVAVFNEAVVGGRATKNTDASPLGLRTAMSWRLN